MSLWINKRYQRPEIFTESLKKAKPFPHLVLSDFLIEERAKELLKNLQKEEFYHKESDLFKFKQTYDLVGSNSDVIKQFREFLLQEFTKHMQALTSIKLSGKQLDLFGTLYQDTDFLLPHDDQLDNRKIAFLFYLSNLKENEGGSLQLFTSENKKPTQAIKKIYPTFNTLAFFEVSPISFHQVEEVIVQKDRVAIGGWLYGK